MAKNKKSKVINGHMEVPSMGLSISNENKITTSNVVKITLYHRMYQYILVVIGVIGLYGTFITGIDLDIINSTLIFMTLASVFVIVTIVSMKKGKLICISVFGALYGIFIYEFFKEISNGFWYIENQIIDGLNKYFNSNIGRYVVTLHDKVLVVRILLLFLIVLLSFILSIELLYIRNTTLSFLLTILCVGIPLIIGKIPNIIYLGCIVLYHISMIAVNKVKLRAAEKKHKSQKENMEQFRYLIGIKSGQVITVMVLVIALSAYILFGKEAYNKLNIVDKKMEVSHFLENLSLEETVNIITTGRITELPKILNIRNTAPIGGLSGGELGNKGEVNFSNSNVLKVKMPDVPSPVYLKGYVGTNYTGKAWEELEEEEEAAYKQLRKEIPEEVFSIGNQSSVFLNIVSNLNTNLFSTLNYYQSTMEVEQRNTNRNYMYHPYYTVHGEGRNIEEPLYVTSKGFHRIENYSYYHSYNSILKLDYDNNYYMLTNDSGGISPYISSIGDILEQLKVYHENELIYRDYVYDTFTKVPESISERMINDFSWDSYSMDGKRLEGTDLIHIVDRVRNYLAENTSYSLKPGLLPEDKDFIEYFLYDNKIGYCAHYASAATVMLRIMGVPARYVEGYIIKSTDIRKGEESGTTTVMERYSGRQVVAEKTVNIKDSNAHAWVEVYVDGFGWIPVEFTAGYSRDTMENQIIEQASVQNQTTNPTPTSKPEPTPTSKPKDEVKEDEVSKSENDKKENKTEKEKTNKNGSSSSNESNSARKNSDNKTLYILGKIGNVILRMFLIAAAVIVIIMLRYMVLRIYRKNQLRHKSNNQMAIRLYKEYVRILEYTKKANKALDGINNQHKSLSIAKKSKYSQHEITKKELDIIRTETLMIKKTLMDNGNYFMKLYYKYIKTFLNICVIGTYFFY